MASGRTTMSAGAAEAVDEALYRRWHPYYAEVCALTEIRKRPGFGVKLHSGIGGHSILYLHGVCLDRRVSYPTLRLCDPADPAAGEGVGISVNAHYRNANWIATEGRDFVWRGALEPGEPLTIDAYRRTQDRARAMGILDGIEFHPHLFRAKPADMSKRDFMYEISIASDYAVSFGRDIFRARVPLDRPRMAAIVAYLNALNAPYRDGRKIYRWRVFNDNCSHLTHNALAAAGIWAPWPTGQFAAIAAFGFPVPKNEFVDLALRTNDLPIDDPLALYNDAPARRALLQTGALPTAPGALVAADRAIGGGALYDTTRLRLIFYDNPFWGPYRFRFARLLGTPRYLDLRANLRHFDALYAAARQRRTMRESRVSGAEQASFLAHYDRHIERAAARVAQQLASLDHTPERPAEAVS